jgi:hypothetical protein
MARIEAADNPRLRLNEAVDFLRAALARASEDDIDDVVALLIEIADTKGDLSWPPSPSR